MKVMKRDFHRCALCGASPAKDPFVELQIDHVIPVSSGGKNNLKNLWTLCFKCNSKKGATMDETYVKKARAHLLHHQFLMELKYLVKTGELPPPPEEKL